MLIIVCEFLARFFNGLNPQILCVCYVTPTDIIYTKKVNLSLTGEFERKKDPKMDRKKKMPFMHVS
jgi:hypothetical protein